MRIYQVRANLYFAEEDEAIDFLHDCELAFFKALDIRPDQPEAEFSTIELIENHHNQNPTAPCVCLKKITREKG